MKKLTLFAWTTFAVLFLLGINCYAGSNVIYGCYEKHGGGLRIVSNNHSCHHDEISISWNKVGPVGPTGPQGPQGPTGPSAPPGLQPQVQDPRVYDAKGQLLGIFPTAWDGLLSFFVPTLSRFLFLSSVSGDVDLSYPSVYLYYDGANCSGKSYLDASVRYQILKVGSKYFVADNSPAVCTNDPAINVTWVSVPQYGDLGGLSRVCQPVDQAVCNPVVPYSEVTLPFSMPVALPIRFE